MHGNQVTLDALGSGTRLYGWAEHGHAGWGRAPPRPILTLALHIARPFLFPMWCCPCSAPSFTADKIFISVAQQRQL